MRGGCGEWRVVGCALVGLVWGSVRVGEARGEERGGCGLSECLGVVGGEGGCGVGCCEGVRGWVGGAGWGVCGGVCVVQGGRGCGGWGVGRGFVF